jgi:conjugative transfer pilus assembly protein TraH
MRISHPRRPLPTGLLAPSLCLCLCLWGCSRAHAADLNAEVNQMFNNLGAVGNLTTPGAFRGQAYNTYTGGSFFMRAPNKVYQLAAIQYPTARAGCGGIDVFGGSFSHISSQEFMNMLRNITAALPGIAFQLALESVSPMLGGLSKWAKGLETMINNARINSCETAKALVSNAAESMGFQTQEACVDEAVQMGIDPDRDAARRHCATDRAGILARARASTDPGVRAKAPFVGNLTWAALQRVSTLDDPERELIMSLVGTVVFYPEEAQRDPEPLAPSITSISQLLYGQGQGDTGTVIQHLLRCTEFTRCESVRLDQNYVHTPFSTRVDTLMHSIARHIADGQAFTEPSPEIGFVNQTSEPVYRMLSIGTSIPDTSLAESLIVQYRDVIAADYAYVFLERNLRVALAALAKDFNLNQVQREQLNLIRQRAQAMLGQIAQEKSVLYQKVGSYQAVAAHMEQLERTLRTSLPQHVMDMLGQRAAYMAP